MKDQQNLCVKQKMLYVKQKMYKIFYIESRTQEFVIGLVIF
jgi:hypothetical protein